MLWLITFVTHNSRVSERMKVYKVRRGTPVVLSPRDQVLVADAILDAAQRHQIAIVALNVLPDHAHLIVAADSETDLGEKTRKLKGFSAYQFRIRHSDVADTKLWAQKFNRRPIRDDQALEAALHYVQHNHLKHAQQWGERLIQTWERYLKSMVDERCTPIQEILEQNTPRG